jgi:hypothetical protein
VQAIVAGDRWLPRFNGELLPDKPILAHWLAAVSGRGGRLLRGRGATPLGRRGGGDRRVGGALRSELAGARVGLLAAALLAGTPAFFAARASRARTRCWCFCSPWRSASRSAGGVTAGGAMRAGRSSRSAPRPSPRDPSRRHCFTLAFGGFLGWQRDLRRLPAFLDPPRHRHLPGSRARLVRCRAHRLGRRLRARAPRRPLRLQPDRRPARGWPLLGAATRVARPVLRDPPAADRPSLVATGGRRALGCLARGSLPRPAPALSRLLDAGAGRRVHSPRSTSSATTSSLPCPRWRSSAHPWRLGCGKRRRADVAAGRPRSPSGWRRRLAVAGLLALAWRHDALARSDRSTVEALASALPGAVPGTGRGGRRGRGPPRGSHRRARVATPSRRRGAGDDRVAASRAARPSSGRRAVATA